MTYLCERNNFIHERFDAFGDFIVLIFELSLVEVELLDTVELAGFSFPTHSAFEPLEGQLGS